MYAPDQTAQDWDNYQLSTINHQLSFDCGLDRKKQLIVDS
jgi:hypothetical protein